MEMFFYELLLFLIILLFLYYKKRNEKWAPLDKIPGPLLGNILLLNPDVKKSVDQLMSFAQQYGSDGMYKMSVGPLGRLIMITDPKFMQPVLSSSVHTHKGGSYIFFKNFLGDGLITANGKKWKESRRMLGPIFNTKMLEGFNKQFFQRNLQFISELEKEQGKPFNIVKCIKRNSFLQMFRTLIDQDQNVDEKMVTDYMNLSKIPMKIARTRSFSIKMFDFIFKLTNEYKIESKAIADIYELINQIIIKKRTFKANYFTSGKTILDVLLDYQQENTDIPDIDLIQQINTFMLAGHDTVSVSISFAIYELSCDRNIQERLLEESNSIFGNDLSIEPTLKELESADYLDRFCKEVLRKYAILPVIARTTTEELKLGDVDIPIGTTLVMLIYYMQRHEKYYKQPLKFDPDRFLPENIATRADCSFIPFSYGPRNCIGLRFAMIQLKSTIVSLVRNYIFAKGDPNFEVSISQAIVLVPLNGILVKIQRRW